MPNSNTFTGSVNNVTASTSTSRRGVKNSSLFNVTSGNNSVIPISPKVPISQKFATTSAPIQPMSIYCAPSSSTAEFGNTNIIPQLVQVQNPTSSSRNIMAAAAQQSSSTIVQYSQNTSSTFTMYHSQQQHFELSTTALSTSNTPIQPLLILPRISSTTNAQPEKKTQQQQKQQRQRQSLPKCTTDSSLQQVK